MAVAASRRIYRSLTELLGQGYREFIQHGTPLVGQAAVLRRSSIAGGMMRRVAVMTASGLGRVEKSFASVRSTSDCWRIAALQHWAESCQEPPLALQKKRKTFASSPDIQSQPR